MDQSSIIFRTHTYRNMHLTFFSQMSLLQWIKKKGEKEREVNANWKTAEKNL